MLDISGPQGSRVHHWAQIERIGWWSTTDYKSVCVRTHGNFNIGKSTYQFLENVKKLQIMEENYMDMGRTSINLHTNKTLGMWGSSTFVSSPISRGRGPTETGVLSQSIFHQQVPRCEGTIRNLTLKGAPIKFLPSILILQNYKLGGEKKGSGINVIFSPRLQDSPGGLPRK